MEKAERRLVELADLLQAKLLVAGQLRLRWTLPSRSLFAGQRLEVQKPAADFDRYGQSAAGRALSERYGTVVLTFCQIILKLGVIKEQLWRHL